MLRLRACLPFLLLRVNPAAQFCTVVHGLRVRGAGRVHMDLVAVVTLSTRDVCLKGFLQHADTPAFAVPFRSSLTCRYYTFQFHMQELCEVMEELRDASAQLVVRLPCNAAHLAQQALLSSGAVQPRSEYPANNM